MNKNIVEGMRDINPLDPADSILCAEKAADEIESLRRQLAESQAREGLDQYLQRS